MTVDYIRVETMKKMIGVDLQPPKEDCGSGSCAWHGSLSVRGRVFRGVVRSAKSRNTVMVEWGYHKYVPKYERYERRKTRVTAHNPECIKAKEGDMVVIGECRPLSKTKHFVILAKLAEGMFEIKGEDLAEKPGEKAEDAVEKAEESEESTEEVKEEDREQAERPEKKEGTPEKEKEESAEEREETGDKVNKAEQKGVKKEAREEKPEKQPKETEEKGKKDS